MSWQEVEKTAVGHVRRFGHGGRACARARAIGGGGGGGWLVKAARARNRRRRCCHPRSTRSRVFSSPLPPNPHLLSHHLLSNPTTSLPTPAIPLARHAVGFFSIPNASGLRSSSRARALCWWWWLKKKNDARTTHWGCAPTHRLRNTGKRRCVPSSSPSSSLTLTRRPGRRPQHHPPMPSSRAQNRARATASNTRTRHCARDGLKRTQDSARAREPLGAPSWSL
jgi:hypothetical protein